jgi:polyhydroxybutyrate depolymerase
MRPFFVFAPVAALVLAVFACSDKTVEATPNPDVPEGGMELEDGAIVGPDGDIVMPDVAPKPSKVNATDETVTVLGAARSYVLVVPKTYDAGRKYPLIIALHGDGQDGPSFRAFVPWDDVAGDDAIVAYPSHAEDLFTPYDQNPDQQLVAATIADVKTKRNIDATKIWGFGYSKGGFIANEVACRKAGVFTAMAIHAGGAPQEPHGADDFPQCPNAVALPVMATEGSNDTDIGGSYGAYYWGKVNGCGGSRSATTPAPCQKTDGCPAGKPVIYCLAPGVSHYPIWNRAVEVSWTFYNSL